MSTSNRAITLSIFALAMFWSATSVHAADSVDNSAESPNPQTSTVELASDATKSAAADAAASIAKDAAGELDVVLADLTLAVAKAAPITIAAN